MIQDFFIWFVSSFESQNRFLFLDLMSSSYFRTRLVSCYLPPPLVGAEPLPLTGSLIRKGDVRILNVGYKQSLYFNVGRMLLTGGIP